MDRGSSYFIYRNYSTVKSFKKYNSLLLHFAYDFVGQEWLAWVALAWNLSCNCSQSNASRDCSQKAGQSWVSKMSHMAGT